MTSSTSATTRGRTGRAASPDGYALPGRRALRIPHTTRHGANECHVHLAQAATGVTTYTMKLGAQRQHRRSQLLLRRLRGNDGTHQTGGASSARATCRSHRSSGNRRNTRATIPAPASASATPAAQGSTSSPAPGASSHQLDRLDLVGRGGVRGLCLRHPGRSLRHLDRRHHGNAPPDCHTTPSVCPCPTACQGDGRALQRVPGQVVRRSRHAWTPARA